MPFYPGADPGGGGRGVYGVHIHLLLPHTNSAILIHVYIRMYTIQMSREASGRGLL